MIWSDETTVQLENHRRYCYRKDGEKPRPKPRPEHPVKVHVWAGIIIARKVQLLFVSVMKAPLFCEILEQTLLPFLQQKFHTHRFMQDNDPKHTSRAARDFFAQYGVNWWRTPAESPEPIENLWHELKEFIRRVVKPTTKLEIVNGINSFWATVDENKCMLSLH